MPRNKDFALMAELTGHKNKYKCPIWHKCLDNNVTEVTKESYVNIVLRTVTCKQADNRFTYMEDRNLQLNELKMKLGIKFQYAALLLSDAKVSKHKKLYIAKHSKERMSKVKGKKILTDEGRLEFLLKVQQKATSLQERIEKILNHECFPSILKKTNHKKIINSLNLALCTSKYSDVVLKDFETRLANRSFISPSQWTYGKYDYQGN